MTLIAFVIAALLLACCGIAGLLIVMVNRPETASGADFERWESLPPTRRDPPPMPQCEPARDMTDWDIALAAEARTIPEPEPGRIDYCFLGITGIEDE